MVQNPNTNILFHLVPLNEISHQSLVHPDNLHFVSASHDKDPGLEVGFHVSSVPGRVIARLGRDADLILQGRNISSVHVAIEIHPDTFVVLLSVRAKDASSVVVTPVDERGRKIEAEKVEGDCVLGYGKRYEIGIANYEFSLVWRQTGPESLREIAIRDYQEALQRQVNVRSRYVPTENDSDKWHNTREHTAQRVLFREADQASRVLVGQGQFGAVYRTVDLESGHPFAVKVIDLSKYANREEARATAYREVKNLRSLSHHIIECLGHAKWESEAPEILMPLRTGNLKSLVQARARRWTDDQLTRAVLEQMLSALDCMACKDMCHRDVKPENILYREGADGYIFQLADFGLSNHRLLAVTHCGTEYYKAPELYPEYGRFAQSPKMDVWSLFATVADINPRFTFPPRWARTYHDVLLAIRAAATREPQLASMVHENPNRRASAAQLLVALFGGRGLTTPRSRVSPLTALAAAPVALTPTPASSKVPVKPQGPFPLVKYARERQRPSPTRGPLCGGVTKPRAPVRLTGRPAWIPAAPAKLPPAEKGLKGD